MGDRISIQFVDSQSQWRDESPVLFSHWDGLSLMSEAEAYLDGLVEAAASKAAAQGRDRLDSFDPLDRLEPGTVMVDFIRHITKRLDQVRGNYYLSPDEDQGDNSDNGHFRLDVALYRTRGENMVKQLSRRG